MDVVVLRRNPELLGAAPGDRPDIRVLLIVLLQDGALGGVDLGNAVGNFEIHQLCRSLQALGVFGALENLAAIGALALEHGARIMQAMRQYADLAIGGRNEFAVEPDQIRTLVEGHCHSVASLGMDGPFLTDSAALLGPFALGCGLLRWERTPGMVACARESAFWRPATRATH